MRILLVSTYEMGHQPLALASPATRLARAGHQVRALDLSVQAFDRTQVLWAEAVAISVPMHTALRLAESVVAEIRRTAPSTPLALYGLYASVGLEAGFEVDAALVGEYEEELVGWAERPTSGTRKDLSVQSYFVPDRDILPGPERYARLETAGGSKTVGYVEGSHGCRHRCRHCPVPVVYDGRYRVVGFDSVMADIDRLVDDGVEHVTFGDPDFLNGPSHAMRLLDGAHARHPGLTFDITVKVEHLVHNRLLLPRMAESGVAFVVSAFESTNDDVLASLEKGHTKRDLHAAVAETRAAGIDVHPTWLPFTPWTRVSDLADIFEFLHGHDLLAVTEPVQMGLRLLVPPGSLVLGLDGVSWSGFDPAALSHTWEHSDPRVDALQAEVAALASRAADDGSERSRTLEDMWRLALATAGRDPSAAQVAPGEVRARITEPWFC